MDLSSFFKRKPKSPSPSPVKDKKSKKKRSQSSSAHASLHKLKNLPKTHPSEQKNEERKEKRSQRVCCNRGLKPKKEHKEEARDKKAKPLEEPKDSRKAFLERFAKYRQWKAVKKAKADQEKKPTFKVGTVHHKPSEFSDGFPSSSSTLPHEFPRLMRSGSLVIQRNLLNRDSARRHSMKK